MNKQIRIILPIAVAVIVWFLPVPDGLTPNAMRFLGIFLGVILALILEPLPNSAVGLIGCTLAGALKLVPMPDGKAATLGSSLGWTLSGFVDSTVWLIFVAYMFALGYEKTGLGKRVALMLIKKLGGKALGLGFATALADLCLAPFIPSNTARSAGSVYPVVKNIPPMYGSLPDNEPRKIGAYLMWICIATTSVTSSMFFTGLAPNLLALSLIGKVPGVDPASVVITWMDWFWCMLPVGVILFILVPVLTYVIYPPTQKVFPETPKWAATELEKLGAVTFKEWQMAGMALIALLLWIFGAKYFNATMVALIVLCLMIILDVISWEDVISNKSAWNTLTWFATLVAMAGGLARVGFLKWLGALCAGYLSGYGIFIIMFGLLALFYFSHYFFASLTAHTTAIMPVLLATGAAVPGLDIRVLGMMLAGSLGIMGILTPYGTGPSPVYYNTGYIERKTFWLFGSLYGFIFFAVYAVFAMFWFPKML
ncbi:MAG: putative sodium:sulfate symporter [Candidatus Desulfovibrio kirbyi]|jgi:L-tartrate/succinate antiporter|uniref:Putative sodium:sulfate symporter n=1 Tax=Candidatus Desulfovibrio kirbyi TaxID=2696086 RepID=A0A6L2R5H1_9BACT|nr:anion permease [Desulfovibrio sp.]GFH62816.1 MAG: putative sodium:sulfate symporter [Candidatus Desulfovibrio kirbyi]